MKLRIKSNRTAKYLYPVINMFGQTFIRELHRLTDFAPGYPIGHSVIATCIGDILYYRCKEFEITERLFLVIDIKGCYNVDKGIYIDEKKGKQRFKDFLKYIRTNKYFESDYWFNEKENLYCITFDLKKFDTVYWNFFYSKYSKMFDPAIASKIGITKRKVIRGKEQDNPIYHVLFKGDRGKEVLKMKVYESFGVEENNLPDEPKEYDIPWFIEDEFMNFKFASDKEINLIKKIKYGD